MLDCSVDMCSQTNIIRYAWFTKLLRQISKARKVSLLTNTQPAHYFQMCNISVLRRLIQQCASLRAKTLLVIQMSQLHFDHG